jgi:hypothetical protein
LIPKVRHIGHFKFIPEWGTKWVNYCGYDLNGRNWDDEWMRDESLFLSLPFCNKCLKAFKKQRGIDYQDWAKEIKNRQKSSSQEIVVKKVSKISFYDEVKKLREYL